MRVRGPLLIAGCTATWLTPTLAHAQRVRGDAWVDAGYSRVRQTGFAPSDVASLAALWACTADAFSVQATASLLAAPDGGAIGGGALDGWTRAWWRDSWRLDLGATADGIVSTDLPGAIHGALGARGVTVRGGTSVWSGLSAGLLRHEGQGLPSANADAGISQQIQTTSGAMRLGGSVTGTLLTGGTPLVPDSRWADLAAFAEWSGARGSLAVSSGARAGSRGAPAGGVFALADATVRIAPALSLVVSAGHQLADPSRALAEAHFVMVGLRFAVPRSTAARSESARPARPPLPGRPVAALRREAGTSDPPVLLILGAEGARVEVMGDFTDWAPVALERRSDGWVFPRLIAAGSHRMLVRVDGGSWTVPANLPTAADDFGGKVGLLVVPE